MAFVLQSSTDGPTATASPVEGSATSWVKPSVAIEFDTFFNPASDPDGNHVALIANGDELTHLASAMPTFDLNDGVVRNVWVDYDATQKLVEVYMSTGPAKPGSLLLRAGLRSPQPPWARRSTWVFRLRQDPRRTTTICWGEAWFVTSKLPKCR